MRVLVVDDDRMVRELVGNLLRTAGFEVVEAEGGREALAAIRRGEARLVVSDMEMPGMGGIELCRAVRSEDLAGYTYVILLSSHAAVPERVAGLSAGADDFVAKPCDQGELLARVRSGERVLALETREMAIFALAKLAESRDPETGAHLERVREYSRVIAQHLAGVEKFQGRIDGEFIRMLYLTSPLHDIGKVGIPDNVLLKPGRLSDGEFEVMKTHCALGARTLDAVVRMFPGVGFLEMARDIALCHHERFDGAGYPAGLAGDGIPLCARIVALADVYDALISRRVYKAALDHDVARAVIASESGRHFDPDIVQAFLANEAKFVAIQERFAEQSRAAA